MRSDFGTRQREPDILQIALKIVVPQVNQHLPQLASTPKVLLVLLKKGDKFLGGPRDCSCKTVVKEAFVPEAHAITIKGKDACGKHCGYEGTRKTVELRLW